MTPILIFILAAICLVWDIHDHKGIWIDVFFILGSSWYILQDIKEHLRLNNKYFKWKSKNEDTKSP